MRGGSIEIVEVTLSIGFPCHFKAFVSIETLGVFEKLVRELIINPSQLAPQEIVWLRHGLILTALFILFPTAARTRLISSNLRHWPLPTYGCRFIQERSVLHIGVVSLRNVYETGQIHPD